MGKARTNRPHSYTVSAIRCCPQELQCMSVCITNRHCKQHEHLNKALRINDHEQESLFVMRCLLLSFCYEQDMELTVHVLQTALLPESPETVWTFDSF